MSKLTRATDRPSSIANVRHQEPTIDTLRTLFWAGAVIATVVLSCAVSRAIYSAILRPAGNRSPTPLYGEGLILPPEPRLEGIEMMSAASAPTNDDRLQKYGWVDRDKQIVHIPIQRAMELAVERGWLRSAASAGDNSKTSDENNSAR